MSLPARVAAMPTPKRRPASARPRTATAPDASRRARGGVHLGFAVFAGVLVTILLVGLVSLQVLLSQTSFRTAKLQSEIDVMSNRYEGLTSDVARLSAPGRVEAWATSRGMVRADPVHTVILPVPAGDGGSGSPDARLGSDAALVKPIVGGAG